MARGRPPLQALREAKAIARRQGKLCENTRGRGILYDFAVHLALITIYVQVKRTKLGTITAEEVLTGCKREIARLRKVPATSVLIRELWVRSHDGAWQFFLVLDDRIVEIPAEAMPESLAGVRHLKADAPGPARSAVAGMVPVTGGGFVCPFMASVK
jgi:hypothetical protein